jgi:cystathionine beta-lyase
MGAATARDEALYRRLKDMTRVLGLGVSADDASLVLRGLQTMALRMERSGVSALRIAQWLAGRAEVTEVLHPALPQALGHDIWKRDFRGANGVFSLLLAEHYAGREAVFIDALRRFKIGASWGGTHSLVAPQSAAGRSAAPWTRGKIIRLSIGIEAIDDLIADLDQAFVALAERRERHHLRPKAAE